MNIHRMQELMQIYDEKLNTSDCSHVFEARFVHETAAWIQSLDELDRAYVFAYIDYIMHQPEKFPQKERTEMMLGMLRCRETNNLTDKSPP